ncbi:MAG: CBS domain-containing protein [Inquilinus sp.]|nr:CBS domain-containing protein [Inquilinus sp.]
MRSQTKIFSQIVQDHLGPQPVIVQIDDTISSMVSKMVGMNQSSALVVDADGDLRGIVTERDLAQRIVFQCQPTDPVREVMTAPVKTVYADDYLYYAIARMRRFGWRHMPVVDRMNRPIGTINRADALAVAAEQILQQVDAISQEGTLEGLQGIKASQVELADGLFQDNVPAPEIQSLLSHINRDIHRRVIEGALRAMADEGWGDPPVRFAAIIMGSGGRGENFLYPDQDNGFVLADYPDGKHTAIDAFFIELADRMTRDLDAVGFPLCPGNVMATNPLWRKTSRQWRGQLAIWSRKSGLNIARLVDIFFDFQAFYGDLDLARMLRADTTAMTKSSAPFLRRLYEAEESHLGVALGLFGRLVAEKGDPEHKGEINLKHAGTLPLVHCARLLSLREGIEETPTLRRIDALHEKQVLDDDRHDYLRGAFAHITGLLLRRQIADFKAGRAVGSHVHLDDLSRREQDMLVDSLKAIADLRKMAHVEFTGDLF